MGCDGGSIPKRSELVRLKKSNGLTSEEKTTRQAFQLSTCALSKEPLAEPICSCLMGKLYNKVAVLEALLDRSKFGDADVVMPHVQGLADVTELKCTWVEGEAVCPVTGKGWKSHSRFVYLRGCGHAFSDAALKFMGHACVKCSEPFTDESVISICPQDEDELARMRLRAVANSVKHKRKRKHRDRDQEGRKHKRRRQDAQQDHNHAHASSSESAITKDNQTSRTPVSARS